MKRTEVKNPCKMTCAYIGRTNLVSKELYDFFPICKYVKLQSNPILQEHL